MRSVGRQIELRFRQWGGKRRNAGRPPRGATPGVAHLARRIVAGRRPVHVTMRVVEGLPSLRERVLGAVVLGALADARGGRVGARFRVVHFSVQSNHLHLVVEADDATSLARGAGGLATRIAMRVNGALGRRGRVFADRFHARELRTPAEVRRALVYVLRNAAKHSGAAVHSQHDVLSSASAFSGWREPHARALARPIPWLEPPRTWLARIGWSRAPGGPISLDEAPA